MRDRSPADSENSPPAGEQPKLSEPRKRVRRLTEDDAAVEDITMVPPPNTEMKNNPAGSIPTNELLAALRPFWDDVVKQMQLLHKESTKKTDSIMKDLVAENRMLRKKLDNIESKLTAILTTNQHTDTNQPTPPVQLPQYRNSEAPQLPQTADSDKPKWHEYCDEDMSYRNGNTPEPPYATVPDERGIAHKRHRDQQTNHLEWLKRSH